MVLAYVFVKNLSFFVVNHGYEPQSKLWTLIPSQGTGYYTLRLLLDCSIYTSYSQQISNPTSLRSWDNFQ